MKILAAARHPGPAEAIVPVIKLLRSQGHQVVLLGLNNNSRLVINVDKNIKKYPLL